MTLDPKQRFSNRVKAYIKYRPSYPAAIFPFLEETISLSPAWRVADIGAGTGILTEMFLKNGHTVYAVEPNKAMRTAAETLLAAYPNFTSINAAAEATTLAAHSIDLVVAGQAFHWFDVDQTRLEFQRILKPGGWVMLIWNSRQVDGTPFMQAYERLLHDYSPDYRQVTHKNVAIDERLRTFFDYEVVTFANRQMFDSEGLVGRLLSSSYAPLKDHPNHTPMLAELRRLFEAHQVGGVVTFEYETKLYYGQL